MGQFKDTGTDDSTHSEIEQREAKLELINSKNELLSTLERITDGFVAFDKQWRYTYVNSNAARMLHKSKEDLIGKVGIEVFPEASKFLAKFKESVESNRPVHFEEYYPEPLNIWYECHCYPSETGLTVFFSDITERKKAEAVLLQKNMELDLLSSITSKLLSSVNPQTLIQEISENIMTFLKCDVFFNFLLDEEQEKLHLNAYNGVSSETAKTIEWLNLGEAICGCAAQKGKRIVCENILETNDPQAALVRSFGIQAYAANPIYADGGKVIGTLSFGTKKKPAFTEYELSLMRTLTSQVSVAMQRKRSEDALKKNEEHARQRSEELQKLMDIIPAAIWISNDPECKVIVGNQMANTFYEARGGENVSAGPASGSEQDATRRFFLNGKELSPSELPMQQAAAKNKEIRNTELEVLLPSGRKMMMLGSAKPLLDNEGKVRGCLGSFVDITERKKAEEELRESEERFLVAFNASAAGAIISRWSDGRYVDVNESFLRMFEYRREEVIGHTSPELNIYAYPEERERMLRLINQGKVHDLEMTFRAKTGRPVNTIVSTQKVMLAGQEHIITTMVDITGRKKAEQALKESEERFSKSFSESPVAVIITRYSDGHYIDVNETFLRLFEYGRNEVIGHTSPELNVFASPEGRAEYLRHFERGRIKDLEMDFRTKTGKLVNTVISSEKINLNGQDHILTTFVDITERKNAEEAIRRQAELIDLSPDGIIVRKLDGTIIFWSKGAEKLYGWSSVEAIGQKTHQLFETKFPKPFEDIMHELNTNKQWTGELVHRTKSGKQVIVQSSWLASSEKSGDIELLESNVDITERKRSEEALKQRTKQLEQTQLKLEDKAAEVEEYACQMEQLAEKRANQLKDAERLAAIGATAGMVGHDIRNPLQAIETELYFARRSIARMPQDREAQKTFESIDAIGAQVDYISKIVSDLQDFAKPLKPELKEINLSELISSTLFAVKVPETTILAVDIEGSPKLQTDPVFVRRALTNLVNNAIQAMPQGGKLTVKASQDENRATITVEDTGKGIPEEAKAKLFTPLFTTKAKGQGFGLAVTKRLIEALGGIISFESEVGKGTRFIVELPTK